MSRRHVWVEVLLAIALLIPLLVLLFLPGGTWLSGGLWFWLILLLLIWMLWMILAVPNTDAPLRSLRERSLRMIFPEDQPPPVREVMDVRLATVEAGTMVFRGPLRMSADDAYQQLRQHLPEDVIPLLQPDEQLETAIILIPRPVGQAALERPVRPWLHWLLFGLTFVTTTWAGALHQDINLLAEPHRFAAGLPYSIGLLLILGVHELGHYFTARHHGMRVTPPFFIPVPFALGTFGAFIQMKSPPENRRMLFDVAVAGPLAGLVIAVPALLIGLQNSEILVGDEAVALGVHGTSVGSSLLFAMLAKLALGDALQYGHMLRLSPLAFAGWLGLLVTALNLLPVGQLDGGHMARAMFGTRAGSIISSVAMWSLLLLAIFVWPALLFWALIVFFIAGRGTPPLNDISPISPARKGLGYLTFLILTLILIPLPHALWHTAGIYCPYL